MYCKQCGKEIGEVNFCPYCGADQSDAQAKQQTYQEYQPINEQPHNQQYYQQPHPREDDESSAGFAILSFIIPIVGLVLYLVWNKEYPKKAKSCLKGIIAGVVLYVVGVCCMISAGIGFASAVSEHNGYDNGNWGWDYDTIVETVPYE